MSTLEFDLMAKTATSLLEVAFRNLLAERIEPGERPGLLLQGKVAKQAAAACTVIAALAIADAANAGADGWPTQAEYAAYWKVTDRHAQNEWALFRRAFPTEDSPDRLAQAIRDTNRSKLREGRADFAGALPAEPLGIALPALA